MVSPLTIGDDMQVGDLVHNPRYTFWGMGIVVDREEEAHGMILVHWLGNGTMEMEQHWCDQRELEIL